MSKDTFTIIDCGKATKTTAVVNGGRVFLSASDIVKALGWELKPEGFCKGSVCFPIPKGRAVISEEGVDLIELADLLDRPLALDIEEGAAYVGTSAGARAAALASLQAPDFTLPDLDGRLHSLSDYRGQKVLLVAYASW